VFCLSNMKPPVLQITPHESYSKYYVCVAAIKDSLDKAAVLASDLLLQSGPGARLTNCDVCRWAVCFSSIGVLLDSTEAHTKLTKAAKKKAGIIYHTVVSTFDIMFIPMYSASMSAVCVADLAEINLLLKWRDDKLHIATLQEQVAEKNLFRPRPKTVKTTKGKQKVKTILKREKSKQSPKSKAKKGGERATEGKRKRSNKKKTKMTPRVEEEIIEKPIVNAKRRSNRYTLGTEGEKHNKGLIEQLALIDIRPDDSDISSDSEPDGETDSDQQSVSQLDDEEVDEWDIPYRIISQGRTNRAMGDRVKYKVCWSNDKGDVSGDMTWELAEPLETDDAYTELIDEWKRRRPSKFNSQAWQKL
jgi:hypothetical protein